MIEKQYSCADILEAETLGEPTEATLGRVGRHLEKTDSWRIISAWRVDREVLDPDEFQQRRVDHNRRSRRLASELASMEYDYTSI